MDKRLQKSLNEIPHCELCGSLIHISQYYNHYYYASFFKLFVQLIELVEADKSEWG